MKKSPNCGEHSLSPFFMGRGVRGRRLRTLRVRGSFAQRRLAPVGEITAPGEEVRHLGGGERDVMSDVAAAAAGTFEPEVDGLLHVAAPDRQHVGTERATMAAGLAADAQRPGVIHRDGVEICQHHARALPIGGQVRAPAKITVEPQRAEFSLTSMQAIDLSNL